jgi:hypothetical protein
MQSLEQIQNMLNYAESIDTFQTLLQISLRLARSPCVPVLVHFHLDFFLSFRWSWQLPKALQSCLRLSSEHCTFAF